RVQPGLRPIVLSLSKEARVQPGVCFGVDADPGCHPGLYVYGAPTGAADAGVEVEGPPGQSAVSSGQTYVVNVPLRLHPASMRKAAASPVVAVGARRAMTAYRSKLTQAQTPTPTG